MKMRRRFFGAAGRIDFWGGGFVDLFIDFALLDLIRDSR